MREKLFNKENLKPVIVLSVICLVVAALMGAVNMITAPIIKEAEEQKVYDSLREVLDGKFEPAELPEGAPATVKAIYKVSEGEELIGHVVTLEKQGYASKIALTVGIDAEGKTTKVIITAQQETHGKNIAPLLDALSAGIGADEVDGVEAVSGATKTSDFIKSAVADAFSVLGYGGGSQPGDDDNSGGGEEDGETLPKTDEQIKEVCNGMLSEGTTLTDISLNDAPDALKRAYSTADNGYFLYIVVPGDYVPVATEAVVHLDNIGKIIKVNLLQWVVGHGVVPDGFADRFTGTDKNSAGDVELVTGATGTSEDFRDALVAAIITVSDGDSARENLLIKRMKSLVPGAESFESVEIPTDAKSTLKKLYKVVGGDGYVAYIITSTKYVDVETECLVYINAAGKVGNIDLITWTVGHGVEPGEFASSMIGKTKEELADVELVTSATVTAGNLRDAVADALAVIPMNYTPVTVGAVTVALCLIAAVTVTIIKRRKNR